MAMNFNDFKRILIAFADDARDLDLSQGELVVQIRDEILQASVEHHGGELFVTEKESDRVPAFSWLINRVGRIPQLARRIEENVPTEPYFVNPSGKMLDRLDSNPMDEETTVEEVPTKSLELLGNRPAGTSTVLYLTSDAGEGKTTIINWMAREQARRYRGKRSDWLLVPISLAGRSFLTFDDIVVAELVNRLRFQFFYYDAFLELVKLGVLVPAFDGFEEMFVEGSSGEALSALGNLMNDLDSSGTVLIAARRAYFEYQNFGTQAKFLGTIKEKSVGFARIGINRWDRARFLEYLGQRKVAHGSEIYSRVEDRFSSKHPLLTRAVLVRRLVETALDGDVDQLIEKLGTKPEDYFYQFVNTIVEREANQKWISRSGTPRLPLLTVKEHHQLLGSVAQEMWISSSEALRGEHLNLLGELFSDNLKKPSQISRQIEQRIRQHSLIRRVSENEDSYAFDHEDFRRFYLGEALGGTLLTNNLREIGKFLEKASLPPETCDSALQAVKRNGGDLHTVFMALQALVDPGLPTSYLVENAGLLVIRLVGLNADNREITVKRFAFQTDSLKGRSFQGISFYQCQFQNTSLIGSELKECRFLECTINGLEIPEEFDGGGSFLNNTLVSTITRVGDPRRIYDPEEILVVLRNSNFSYPEHEDLSKEVVGLEIDEETLLAERALRAFLRSTQINESVFRLKFGKDAAKFIHSVLPQMIERGVLQEIPYRGGGGVQRRFGLRVSMNNIETAIPVRVRTLDEFLEAVLQKSS